MLEDIKFDDDDILGDDDEVRVGTLIDLLDRVVEDSFHVDLAERGHYGTFLAQGKASL